MFKKNKANKAIKNNGLKKFSILSAVALLSSYLITAQIADRRLSNISSVSAFANLDWYDEIDDTDDTSYDFGDSFRNFSFGDVLYVRSNESESSLLKEDAFKDCFGCIGGTIRRNLRLSNLMQLANKNGFENQFHFSDFPVSEDFVKEVKNWEEYKAAMSIANYFGGFGKNNSASIKEPGNELSRVYSILAKLQERLLRSLSGFATMAKLKTYKEKAVAAAASSTVQKSNIESLVKQVQWDNLLNNSAVRDKACLLVAKAIECFNGNKIFKFCKFAESKIDFASEAELKNLYSALKFILIMNAAISNSALQINNIILDSMLHKILSICESEATSQIAYDKFKSSLNSLADSAASESGNYGRQGILLLRNALQALGSKFMDLSYEGISQIFKAYGKNYMFLNNLSKFLLECGIPLKNIFSMMSGSALIAQPLAEGRKVAVPLDITKNGQNSAGLKQLERDLTDLLTVVLSVRSENTNGYDSASSDVLGSLQNLLDAVKSLNSGNNLDNVRPDFMLLSAEAILNFVGKKNTAQALRRIQLEMQANARKIDYINTQLKLYSFKDSYYPEQNRKTYKFYESKGYNLFDEYLNSDYITGFKSLYKDIFDDTESDDDSNLSISAEEEKGSTRRRTFDEILTLSYGKNVAKERVKDLQSRITNIKQNWENNVLKKLYEDEEEYSGILNESLGNILRDTNHVYSPAQLHSGKRTNFVTDDTANLISSLLAMTTGNLVLRIPQKYVEKRAAYGQIPLLLNNDNALIFDFDANNNESRMAQVVKTPLATLLPPKPQGTSWSVSGIGRDGNFVNDFNQNLRNNIRNFKVLFPQEKQLFYSARSYVDGLNNKNISFPKYKTNDAYTEDRVAVNIKQNFPFMFYNDVSGRNPLRDAKRLTYEQVAFNNYYENNKPHFDMKFEIYRSMLDKIMPSYALLENTQTMDKSSYTIADHLSAVRNHFIDRLEVNSLKNSTTTANATASLFTSFVKDKNIDSDDVAIFGNANIKKGYSQYVESPTGLLIPHLYNASIYNLKLCAEDVFENKAGSYLLNPSKIEESVKKRLAEFKKILSSQTDVVKEVDKAVASKAASEKNDEKSGVANWKNELIYYGVFDGADGVLPTENGSVEATDQNYTFAFDIPTNVQKDKFVILVGTETIENSSVARRAEAVRVDGTTNPKSQIKEFTPQGDKLTVTIPKSYFKNGINEIHLKHRDAAAEKAGKDYSFLKKYKYYKNDEADVSNTNKQEEKNDEAKKTKWEFLKKGKYESPENIVDIKKSDVLIKEKDSSAGVTYEFDLQLKNNFNRNVKLMGAFFQDGVKPDPTHQFFDLTKLVDSNNKLRFRSKTPQPNGRYSLHLYEKEISSNGKYLGKVEAGDEKDTKRKSQADYGKLNLYSSDKDTENLYRTNTSGNVSEDKQKYSLKFTARRNTLVPKEAELKIYSAADEKLLATTKAQITNQLYTDRYYSSYGEKQYTIEFEMPEIDEKTEFYIVLPVKVARLVAKKQYSTRDVKMKSNTLTVKSLNDTDKIRFDYVTDWNDFVF